MDHIEDWVASCNNLKIPITAAAAVKAVCEFHKEPAITSLESECPLQLKFLFY